MKYVIVRGAKSVDVVETPVRADVNPLCEEELARIAEEESKKCGDSVTVVPTIDTQYATFNMADEGKVTIGA